MRPSLVTVARLVAAAAAVATVVALPFALRDAWRDVRNARATPRTERTVAPAEQVGIESAAELASAARVIPRGATYVLVTGPGAQLRDPSSVDYVKFWSAFTLLPRRRVDHVQDAGWIVAYGGDPRHRGVPVAREVDLGGGVRVAEVRRP